MSAQSTSPIIIKKYANRRLYNTGTSTYVTLDDLSKIIRAGEDFQVVDAKSGEDITHSVLTQIIFERENKGDSLLPISFLRQLISLYGGSMQNILPSFLDYSLSSFTKEKDIFSDQISAAFNPNTSLEMIQDQVRRNIEVFQKATQMFMPFAPGAEAFTNKEPSDPSAGASPPPDKNQSESEDIAAIKQQLADLQSKLESFKKEQS